MDTALLIIGVLCLIIGLIGCVAPILPGPPTAYAGLILMQFTESYKFSIPFLITMAILVIAVSVLDYVIPSIGTKKFGGSKYGSTGCLIGTFAGIFIFPPFGIILMPFAGAFAGEIIYKKNFKKALKAAFGSLLGFLGGVLCKSLICIIMIIAALISIL